MIVKPQAIRFDARRRIEPLYAQRLKPLGETIEIVVERAERDVSELLARTLAEGNPDMRIAARLHGQKTALLVDLEPELAVEIFGDREIGNSEMKPVDRMNAKFARTSGRLDGGCGWRSWRFLLFATSRLDLRRSLNGRLERMLPQDRADRPRSARARVAASR